MNGMKWDTYMYTMEHFSAFNRKKILTHAAMWMDLEDVILCNISQTEKTKKMRKRKNKTENTICSMNDNTFMSFIGFPQKLKH